MLSWEYVSLLLRPDQERSTLERQYLAQLRVQDVVIATTCDLVEDFLTLLRTRAGARLGDWLARVATEGSAAVQRFAASLENDRAAVQAGLTQPESNGVVEGHVHRLKLLKRQCYGRAGFATLRARVLHA